MPILIMSATGDEFFAPDDSYVFFDQLIGPKYLRILPNIEHTTRVGLLQVLSSPNSINSIRSFYLSVKKQYPMPTLSWERGVDEANNAEITLTTDKMPILINGWMADSQNSTR